MMQCFQAVALVGFLFCATFLLAGARNCSRDATSPTADARNFGGDSKLMQLKRVKMVKRNILRHLGLEEEPENLPDNISIPIEFLQEYEAVKIAQQLNHEIKPCAFKDYNTEKVIPVRAKEVNKSKRNLLTAAGDHCIGK